MEERRSATKRLLGHGNRHKGIVHLTRRTHEIRIHSKIGDATTRSAERGCENERSQ